MSESTDTNARVWGYGLIGAGGFGRFCLDAYAALNNVQPRAVADANPCAAEQLADATSLDAAPSVDALLARDDIDLVHIATPPFTHRELVTAALEAGKHVLCEKPLAITRDDAKAMIGLAHDRHRLLAVNLIMRYNPLCGAVKKLIDERLLGEPLHGFFENYAKDEPLSPDHWFWQRDKSGGIFIEHGVHFFDLFAYWLGAGEAMCAQQVARPGSGLIEQAHATVRYADDTLVNFYHGFTQAERMDRQELRLHFERGTVQLFEWVPTSITIDALVDDRTAHRIAELLPAGTVRAEARYTGDDRQVTSRHKPYEADGRYRITSPAGMDKPALYGHVLRALLADQLRAIHEPSHGRLVTEANGLSSLELACAADELTRFLGKTQRT